MSKPHELDQNADAVWHAYLAKGDPFTGMRFYGLKYRDMTRVFKHLPSEPRCRICYAPFEGVGGRLVRLAMGTERSRMNPTLCNNCEEFVKQHRGGTEIPLSMLFADVRGSTGLAERLSPTDFRKLIDRFYQAVTGVMIESSALIEKLMGDEVTGLFVPGLAGPEHARAAIDAAQKILRVTGHAEASGPWVPVGAGVHTGTAYVGAVGSDEGMVDIAALGDDVNVAARLASQAGPGEVVVSQAAAQAAELDTHVLESRRLQLKGRSEPVDVWVMRVAPG